MLAIKTPTYLVSESVCFNTGVGIRAIFCEERMSSKECRVIAKHHLGLVVRWIWTLSPRALGTAGRFEGG